MYSIQEIMMRIVFVLPLLSNVFSYAAVTSSSRSNCNFENTYKRKDCGWPGIGKYECEARGCCYDDRFYGVNECLSGDNAPDMIQEMSEFEASKRIHTTEHKELQRRFMAKKTNVQSTKAFTRCICHGTEARNKGPGPRKFHIYCKENDVKMLKITTDRRHFANKKTKLKPKQNQKWLVNCTYRGNPHCDEYVKNTQYFYDELLEVIGEELCAQRPSKTCIDKAYNTKTTCSDVEFNLDQ